MRSLLFVSLALALPVAAAAEPFAKPLQQTCAQLQREGWTAPLNLRTQKPGKPEISVAGKIYMCTLMHALPHTGAGHAPDLQALLLDEQKGTTIVLSANIWCTADRTKTLDALAKQLESTVGKVPEPISSAIRAAKDADATAAGLSFEVRPVDVDPGACDNVPAGQLGPVLLTIDVQVKPAKR
jgi:hypothetical protein